MAHLRGVEDTDRHGRRLEGGDDRAFVAAGGFTDHVRAGDGPQQAQELGMACRVFGQGVGAALEVELEAGLGNVQAGVDDGRWRRQVLIVLELILAHTSAALRGRLHQRFE